MSATTLRGNRAKGNDGDQQVRAADYLAAIALHGEKRKSRPKAALNSNLMVGVRWPSTLALTSADRP